MDSHLAIYIVVVSFIPICLITTFIVTLIGAITWRFFRTVVARSSQLSPKWNEAIFVTGATSGIGLVVAKRMFQLGYSVIIGYYDASEPGYNQLHKIYDEARQASSAKTNQQVMLFVELDVRSRDSIAAAYTQVEAALVENKLQLHALINNAGLGSLQPFAWVGRALIKSLAETNQIGLQLMSREFLPLLIRAKGRLINVSSGLAFVKGPNFSIYGASKIGAVYFTQALNTELKNRFGVQGVAVIPDNFIKATDICAQNMRNNLTAWEQLKPIEKILYQGMFDEHNLMLRSIDEKYRDKDEPNSDWNRMADGSDALEKSGLLTAFEDAVRLRHPPEILFAGSRVFSLVIGSMIVSLPHSLFNLFTSAVPDSLYK